MTSDGHDTFPRAIRETLGLDVLHRTNRYLNNRPEQDHRGIKQCYSFAVPSMRVHQFFRFRTTMRTTGFDFRTNARWFVTDWKL